MKKLISLLLVLVMMLPVFSVMAEEEYLTSYSAVFEWGDMEGWHARSADGGAKLNLVANMLNIKGRTEPWNSIAKEFNFQPGTEYSYSLEVRQMTLDTADFILSMAHSKDGQETYENLQTVTAKKGEWVEFSGKFTPAEFDNYILYVETAGNGTLDYAIRNITVEKANASYDEVLPSLYELYAPYFDFGGCLPQNMLSDSKRMAVVKDQYNILTHENELKPDAVLDVAASRNLAKEDETAVAVKFNAAKPMLDYCQKNGIKVHGHVLAWHSQTPAAFFHEGYDTSKPYVTREVMLARLENYIRLVFEYTEANYPGLIVSWDVVNEAVADGSTQLRTSNWTKVVGQDFVNRAFEYARKYAPEGCLLYYNDYSTPYEPKLTGICNLLDSLVADGNIDGYGFQCHYSTGTPTIGQVRTALNKIAAKGLKLRVSELDIGISGDNSIQRTVQADKFKQLMKLFVEFADQMEAVQVWGVTDDRSWRSDEYPLLFDLKIRPKEAFFAVAEAATPEE